MIEEVLGSNGSRFVIAAAAVGIALLLLFIVLRLLRNRPSSPFLRGGKNRQPRLAVLDAAAVDTRRRLVLVRRDDVEHLIMIGGPTDVVIESRIVDQSAVSQAPVPQPAISQPVVATPLQQQPQPVATPAVEQRAVRPAPEKREIPTPEPKRAPPVSNVGSMLYADDTDPVLASVERSPAVRPVAEPVARSVPVQTVERAPPVRTQQAVQAPQPVQVQQPREQQYVPVPVAAQPAVETMKSPEDILDAARTRVLPSAVASPIQRPAIQAEPLQQKPTEDKAASVAEFERILDAQISGDLGRLSADDGRLDAGPRVGATTPTAGGRQEPSLDPAEPEKKTRPTLEEEMSRMWTDISSRKS